MPLRPGPRGGRISSRASLWARLVPATATAGGLRRLAQRSAARRSAPSRPWPPPLRPPSSPAGPPECQGLGLSGELSEKALVQVWVGGVLVLLAVGLPGRAALGADVGLDLLQDGLVAGEAADGGEVAVVLEERRALEAFHGGEERQGFLPVAAEGIQAGQVVDRHPGGGAVVRGAVEVGCRHGEL